MSGTRAISTTSRRELSSSSFFLLGKAPEEIHAILTETLASFLPGRAKDPCTMTQLYFIFKLRCDITLVQCTIASLQMHHILSDFKYGFGSLKMAVASCNMQGRTLYR